MRTKIDIDDDLMREAMRTSGAATKKAAVEAGLRLFVQTFSQSAIRKLKGKVHWAGNLNQSRLRRTRSRGRKQERLEVRMTSNQKHLIEHAAKLRARTVTEFVVASAQQAASDAIRDFEVLSFDSLLNPPSPHEAARAVAHKGKRMRSRKGGA